MRQIDLVLRGDIVIPERVLRDGWIAVRDGRILAVGCADQPAPDAARTVDHSGRLILPGVVDGQTHATSARGLPGIESTTRSAIAGGVTTLVDMPYDNPLPLDRIERFQAKADAIAAHSHADMALYATVTSETRTRHVDELVRVGVCAFKVSSFESSSTRFPRIGADVMLELFTVLKDSGLPLGLHNEDQEIVLHGIAAEQAAGREGIAAHAASRPIAAELAATAQFLALAQATGAHAHPVHVSCGQGLDMVSAFATDLATRATAETCVHYLWFDLARNGGRLGARMKVSPPIRAGEIDAIWAAIVAGKVALTSSDHSSWPIDGKLTPSIFAAGAGVPGVETLLPAFFTAAAARGLDAATLTASQLSSGPARLFGLEHKGRIAPGFDADFAILERGTFVWDEAATHDELCWSPFHGETFGVRVASTWLRGAEVWDGKDILNAPGSGRYVARTGRGWFGAVS